MRKDEKDKVVFILGPTAVGKSAVAVKLAQKFGGEIISADSVQIFKGLDIGSAKVTEEEMAGVVHFGIDICEPDETFSAFQFAEFTKQKIKEISERGCLPIVVGGTGLYVRALVDGYNFGGAEKDETLRAELEKIAKEKGASGLLEILISLAPDVAQQIDKNNPVRLIRAIEIARGEGQKAREDVEIKPLVLALTRPRDELYADINRRVDEMLKNGLVEEVERLKKRGLTIENQSMRAIGYKEVLAYLNGEIDYERMVELVKQHSRNYAKRQLTFLRGMDCEMVDMSVRDIGFAEIIKKVETFLKN